MIIKPLGAEVSIATANSVSDATLVRVLNTGAAAVLHIAANSGTEYANLTVSNTESVIVVKNTTDTLTGANMLAVPVAYRY